ncbi:MAG: helix-turn-helix domain-containing protein [Lachnospiraceae bacterium]|nr:helix-turn-helix domain-containing protein [Lachnospiraceae bacterium]
MEKERKNESFVFYGTTYDSIMKLAEHDKDQAFRYMVAVMQYGLYEEYDHSDVVVDALMQQAKFGIDKAKSNRERNMENGKKGGRKKQFEDEAIWKMREDGMKNTEIAKQLGCSVRTVERALKKQRESDTTTDKIKNDGFLF